MGRRGKWGRPVFIRGVAAPNYKVNLGQLGQMPQLPQACPNFDPYKHSTQPLVRRGLPHLPHSPHENNQSFVFFSQ